MFNLNITIKVGSLDTLREIQAWLAKEFLHIGLDYSFEVNQLVRIGEPNIEVDETVNSICSSISLEDVERYKRELSSHFNEDETDFIDENEMEII